MIDRLKKYRSIKQLHAEPMTFGTFNDTIRPLPGGDKLDPLAPGYHTIYNMGTEQEHHSWCPKKIFEEGNVEITVPGQVAHA